MGRPLYAWFVRMRGHTGLYLTVGLLHSRVSEVAWQPDLSAAEAFRTPLEALDFARWANYGRPAVDVEIVDYAFTDAAPEADEPPVPTREEIIRAALAHDTVQQAIRARTTWKIQPRKEAP